MKTTMKLTLAAGALALSSSVAAAESGDTLKSVMERGQLNGPGDIGT